MSMKGTIRQGHASTFCIKIQAEMTEKSQVKNLILSLTAEPFFGIISLNMDFLLLLFLFLQTSLNRHT